MKGRLRQNLDFKDRNKSEMRFECRRLRGEGSTPRVPPLVIKAQR